MKNTHLAKTLTASLPGNAQATFARISDPDNLPGWHSSFLPLHPPGKRKSVCGVTARVHSDPIYSR